MEKRLSVKCDNYLKEFKYNIKNFIDSSDMNLSYLSQDTRLLMSNSEHFISLVPWVP